MRDVAQACESVCHPPLQSVFLRCLLKGRVCLFCHFVVLHLTCVGVWVGAKGLVLNHDLSPKSCGISSATQAAPTTVDVTLLLMVFRLSAPSSASSCCANTCLFAEKRDRKQTLFLTNACTKIRYVLLPFSFYLTGFRGCSCICHASCVMATDQTGNKIQTKLCHCFNFF